jgi:hypothetical protein
VTRVGSVLATAALASGAALAPPPAAAQEPNVTGCWALQIGAWEPALETHDPGFAPPAWFELRGRRGGREGAAIYGGSWTARERHWKWSRLRRGGVAVVFSRGFAGYHLRLGSREGRLEGTIEAFSDVRGRSRAPATATRSSCPKGGA